MSQELNTFVDWTALKDKRSDLEKFLLATSYIKELKIKLANIPLNFEKLKAEKQELIDSAAEHEIKLDALVEKVRVLKQQLNETNIQITRESAKKFKMENRALKRCLKFNMLDPETELKLDQIRSKP